jgi:formylmethanofuran dehydrogenase subunit E
MRDEFNSCESCGKPWLKDELIVIGNGEVYCSDCFLNYQEQAEVGTCEVCGKYFWFDSPELNEINGKYYCENCISQDEFMSCESCGINFLKADMKEIGGEFYCKNCRP